MFDCTLFRLYGCYRYGSIGLQADTVALASGYTARIPSCTVDRRCRMQSAASSPLQGASALTSADRYAGGQHVARIPCYTLATEPKKCTLKPVQLRNLGSNLAKISFDSASRMP